MRAWAVALAVWGACGSSSQEQVAPKPQVSKAAVASDESPPDRSTLAKYEDFAESACACSSKDCQKTIRGELEKWERSRVTVDAQQEREIAAKNRRIGRCLALDTDDKAAPQTQSPFGVHLGIPNCDDYFSKYMTCVSRHVPEAARAQMLDAFTRTAEAWKKAATTPDGRAALAEACTHAMDAAKAAMEQFGCQW